MQDRHYQPILYFVSLVVLITLGIQVYWNYKNFQSAKQQLINEVQTSVDNAIDAYYVDLADKNTIGLTFEGDRDSSSDAQLNKLYKFLDSSKTDLISSIDSIDPKEITGFKFLKKSTFNDTSNPVFKKISTNEKQKAKIDSFFGTGKKMKFPGDSLFKLASKVIISITTDTLQTSPLNTFIDEQLKQKKIEIDYGYIFENNSGNLQTHNPDITDEESLSTTSKSAYLPKNSSFKFFFNPNTALILKRNLLGLVLSAILIACVIGCLLFLLQIIKRQKKLADMKNDLISNITHEFKTPISTVKVALEGIADFNKNNDPVKTRSYLEISNTHLGKLQMMVEKLLETATLDGDQLQMNREELSIALLLKELIAKHKDLAPDKNFHFEQNLKNVWIMADPFHLENALNNILDNAVKYGGETINILLSSENEKLIISIADSGHGLGKSEAAQVFEKFYRVPKGNTHDVKGFGIGLYYTKKIIEKHGGSISVDIRKHTNFIIELPRNV
ncbi:HAMP domain-containing sensor histidine kinase [Gramella sp. AN32]|uniref:histidine kinase n=1 Tax=Christiangramia antarctica TaxID=2058158 RepID=A0ABW5X2R8_9FLAO|nr:HAMP domain-containing sensor histidine kinase [Gramella sp. AN32]MCM4157768.1 two-component sensor histidine kinase [Gramella sp. AN32]